MNGRCEGGDQGRGGGPDVCTFATCLGHLCTTCRKYKTARNSAGSTNSCTYREKRLSLSTNLHQNTHTVNGTCSGVSESLTLSVCAKTEMVQTIFRYSQYGPEPLIEAS